MSFVRWRGKFAEGELADLVEYIWILTPKGEKANFQAF
jgi:hypothetical protein